MNDLIILAPQARRLVPIPDRPQPDFCEICEGTKDLFWTGKFMCCISCGKMIPKARKEGKILPDGGGTINELVEFLRHHQSIVDEMFDKPVMIYTLLEVVKRGRVCTKATWEVSYV